MEEKATQCRSASVKNPNGEAGEAWVVDYIDASCKRRLKTFRRKRDADTFYTTTAAEPRVGTHIEQRNDWP
jgi:hypothetical protein